ncbi:MAG: hypothetical protein R3E79_23250 [Caldilineaceae bacterium]
MGLDALKAQTTVGLAMQAGGVVYPPITLAPAATRSGPILHGQSGADGPACKRTVGVPAGRLHPTILISGHYPNRSQYWMRGGSHQRPAAPCGAGVGRKQAPGIDGHAANASSLSIWTGAGEHDAQGQPDDDIGRPDRINWMGDEYEGHPCYGLVGIDLRSASAAIGQKHRRLITFWEWLDKPA